MAPHGKWPQTTDQAWLNTRVVRRRPQVALFELQCASRKPAQSWPVPPPPPPPRIRGWVHLVLISPPQWRDSGRKKGRGGGVHFSTSPLPHPPTHLYTHAYKHAHTHTRVGTNETTLLAGGAAQRHRYSGSVGTKNTHTHTHARARAHTHTQTHAHTHTHTIAKHSTTMVAECESSSVGVKQKACSTPIGAFL